MKKIAVIVLFFIAFFLLIIGKKNNAITIDYVDSKKVLAANDAIDLSKFMVDDDKNYILNLEDGITVANIKELVNTTGQITVLDKSGNIMPDNNKIKSGDKLNVSVNDNLSSYTLVVRGDVFGSGELSIANSRKIAKHIVDKNVITDDLYLQAADYNNDGLIRMNDVIALTKKINSKSQATIVCNNKTYNGSAQAIATCIGGTIQNAIQTDIGEYKIECTGDNNHTNASEKTCSINLGAVLPITKWNSNDVYNAKCDGVTDDTDAIQAAFLYANDGSHGISKIDVGSGECKITKPISIYCNNKTRKIEISGKATFKHNNTTFLVISSACDDVTIDGITSISSYSPYNRDINNDGKVDGNDSISHITNNSINSEKGLLELTLNNVTLEGGVSGTSLNNLNRLTVKNSTFKNMHFVPEYGRGGYGILFQGSRNVTIINNNFVANEYFRHAIYASVSDDYSENNNIVVDNCVFDYSGIKEVNFMQYDYPSDKIYEWQGNIWSPDITPIMVRKTNDITVSNSTFVNAPTTSFFTGENGPITGINLKNLTIYPKIWGNTTAGYGAYLSGRSPGGSTIYRVDGVIDNLNVIDPPVDYNLAYVSHGTIEFKNISTNLPIYNATPATSIITGP